MVGSMSIRQVCTSLRGGSTSSDLAVDDDVGHAQPMPPAASLISSVADDR